MWEYFKRLEHVNDTAVTKLVDLFGEDPRRRADKFEPHALCVRSRFGVNACNSQVNRFHHELNAAVSGSVSLSCRLAPVCSSLEKRFANGSKLDATQAKEKFREVTCLGGQEMACHADGGRYILHNWEYSAFRASI
jgi:hypothetical protein